MMAIRYRRFGKPEVLEWVEVPAPRARAGEVLVKVAAAAVNPKDCLVRKGKFRHISGRRFPRGAGYDFSGTVVEPAQGYAAGDPVYGMLNGWAGGSCAQYVAVPAGELAPAPRGIALEEAAGIPLAAQTALQALRDQGGLRAGQRVLINGAAGGVGTLAVQIAKALGASVIASCSARNADFVRALGADAVLDYATTPLERWPGAIDVFFDVFGNASLAKCRALLSPHGVYVSTVPSLTSIRDHVLGSLRRGRRGRLVVVRSNAADLRQLSRWIEDGRLQPVTDRRFPMAQAADAHRHVETRRARGKVLLIP